MKIQHKIDHLKYLNMPSESCGYQMSNAQALQFYLQSSEDTTQLSFVSF